jgi:diguanylate cyclase (GGDEF)-like protein
MPDSLLLILASSGVQALITLALGIAFFWYAQSYAASHLRIWAGAMLAFFVAALASAAGFSLSFQNIPVDAPSRLIASFFSQFGFLSFLLCVAFGARQFADPASEQKPKLGLLPLHVLCAVLALVITFSFIQSPQQIVGRLVLRIGLHYAVGAAVFWLVLAQIHRARVPHAGILKVCFAIAALLQTLIVGAFLLQLYLGSSFAGRLFPLADILMITSVGVGLSFWLLQSEREKLLHARDELTRLSYFDALTGVANQDRLMELLDSAIQQRQDCALILIDLDQFRTLGDTLGRARSNELIREVSQRIKSCAPARADFARLKHDTFALLVRHAASAELEYISEQIHSKLAPAFELAQRLIYLTASIGIALAPTDANSSDELLRAARLAVNQGKTLGRGQSRFFAPELNAAADARLGLISQLRQALSRDEFQLHFQPIFTRDGALVGFEALLRWQHPERGLLMPDSFISMLSPAAIHGAVDRLALRRALEQIKAWRKRFGLELSVSVNISAASFQDQGFVDSVSAMLSELAIPATALELEITESTTLENIDLALNVLTRLKGLGVCVALDDFGTGYSSLSHLRLLPISTIKIDRSFVRDVPFDQKDAAIISAITQLSHNLGLKVIAEGIETTAQRVFLSEQKVDFLQGYLLGHPKSAQNIEAELLAGRPQLSLAK